MTIEEMFPLIMIEFSKLNARLDKLENPVREVIIEPLKIKKLEDILPEDWKKASNLFADLNPKDADTDKCFWVNMSPEDRLKPMGLSCPCKRCSPMSCSVLTSETMDKTDKGEGLTRFEDSKSLFEHLHIGVNYSGNKPAQFPNESYVDYMKRTGQCVEAHCVGKDTCN